MLQFSTTSFVKNLSQKLVFITLYFISFSIYAQDITTENALKIVKANASKIGLSEKDIENVEVTNAYKVPQDDIIHIYLQQTHNGIGVYNMLQILTFKNGTLINNAGARIRKLSNKVNLQQAAPVISSSDAVRKAAAHLQITILQPITPIEVAQLGKKISFGKLGIAQENVVAQLLWVPISDNEVRLAWQVQIVPNRSPDHWMIRVDAENSDVIGKDNYTVKCTWQKLPHNHSNDCIQTTHFATSNAKPALNKYLNNLRQVNATTLNNATYRVVPYPAESPDHAGGTPVIVNNPWLLSPAGSAATTLKWHDDGVTEYASSRGNNVYAQEDRDNNNTTFGNTSFSSTPLPNLTFSAGFNPNASPLLGANQDFMITNLFYWNNIMHDLSYLYGFTEVAGNFQSSNQNRGGQGNDYVIADAQDGSGTNNANFSTPVDGNRPRMQMYLWDPTPSRILNISLPETLSGFMTAREGNVSTNNKLVNIGPISGVVHYFNDDNTGTTHEACLGSAFNSGALAGKIALIDRSTACNFIVKIKNAQLSGAIGVIMVNNIGGEPTTMTGTDNTITIPSVMVSQANGQLIKTELNNANIVSVTLAGINMDGDVDNGIIAHEYTHGISTRLTGGPANSSCLQNAEQMGEGWSDYFALMATTNWATANTNDGLLARPIGAYVLGQSPITGAGIRRFPYSTNLSINPLNYAQVSSIPMINTQNGLVTPVHSIGEVWCTALWEMTWEIINQDGINPNIFNPNGVGGNSIALRLVTEGLKLQPCSPGFVDGRNAILKADTLLYNGKYSCAIWKAFAKRGLGTGASQGSSTSYTDQVADSRTPVGALIRKTSNKIHASVGEQIEYTLQATCQCTPIANMQIIDTLASNVTYVSGGNYSNADRTIKYNGISLAAAANQSFTYRATVNNGAYTAPTTHLNEQFVDNTLPFSWFTLDWAIANNRSKSAPNSMFTANTDVAENKVVQCFTGFPLTRISTISFWHYYNTESGYDGGVVELSTDGGATWFDAGPYFSKNGYNTTIAGNAGTSLSNKQAFSGSSNGVFIETSINLTSFAGSTVFVRFRFVSDTGTGGDGWYIDDVNVLSQSGVYNKATLYDGANITLSTSENITTINAFTLPVIWGSFTVEKLAKQAILKWDTKQEVNVAKFIIEKSADGLTFSPIATIAAKGNSTIPQYYTTADISTLKGWNYYRIKQVDNDGKYSYSQVRQLYFEGPANVVSIIPNPIKSTFNVSVSGNTDLLTLQLQNNVGEIVANYQLSTESVSLQLPANIAKGVYYLKINGKKIARTEKILVY